MAVTALMAVAPAVASAALSITATNLVRTSGPPGARLIGGTSSTNISQSTVTVTRTEGTTLGSVHYSYAGTAGTPNPTVGASGCVNVTNLTGGATASGNRNVNPALPRAPGTYTISLEASSVGCAASGGTRSEAFPGPEDPQPPPLTVTQPAANRTSPLVCGLKVALILDESSSISDAHIADVQKAANGFVDALRNTGASVGIVAFAQRARVGVPYTPVTQDSIDHQFRPFINNGYPAATGRAGTNWEGAFLDVDQLGPPPDLVVFVTDGDPNGINATTSFSPTVDGGVDVMTPAVNAANDIKATSRVFAIGVGAALENPASISRLTAVSGPTEFPDDTSDFSEGDYTSVDFDHLRESLVRIVSSLCGGRIEIVKSDFDHNGEFEEAQGWTFTATLKGPPHEWLPPSEAGAHASARVTTNSHGHAELDWRLEAPGDATVSVVREHLKPGFHLVLAECEVHRPDGSVRRAEQRTTGPIAEGLVVPPMGWVTCEVHNSGPGAHLTVVKNLVPSSDPGRFDLLVGGIPRIERVGDGGSTPRLLLGFGRHAVRERVTAAQESVITLHQYSIRTRCVNKATGDVVASGTGPHAVYVRLEHETDDVVCTITNHRITARPPHVPDPGPPRIPPGPPAVPPAVGRGHLVITKRMPARARIGHRVPVRITVRNVGRETAHDAVLHETPIRGGRIVHVAGHRATRHSDGTVTWNLGNLAPGARRTVHATMLVTRRVLLLNRAVADAADTGPAFDDAAVRVTRPPAPPRFTG